MLETGLGRVHRILAGPPPSASWYPAAGAAAAVFVFVGGRGAYAAYMLRCTRTGGHGAAVVQQCLLATALPIRLATFPCAGTTQARLAVLFASGLCAVYDLDQQVSMQFITYRDSFVVFPAALVCQCAIAHI